MPVDRDPWLIVRARQLRANQTSAETVLWQKLRAKRLAGHRFRRQHPIGPFIVDFVCLAAGLVVEVDGPTHENPSRDERRDRELVRRGFETLRVWNNDVYENLDGVLEMINNKLPPPSPLPPPVGGRGQEESHRSCLSRRFYHHPPFPSLSRRCGRGAAPPSGGEAERVGAKRQARRQR